MFWFVFLVFFLFLDGPQCGVCVSHFIWIWASGIKLQHDLRHCRPYRMENKFNNRSMVLLLSNPNSVGYIMTLWFSIKSINKIYATAATAQYQFLCLEEVLSYYWSICFFYLQLWRIFIYYSKFWVNRRNRSDKLDTQFCANTYFHTTSKVILATQWH